MENLFSLLGWLGVTAGLAFKSITLYLMAVGDFKLLAQNESDLFPTIFPLKLLFCLGENNGAWAVGDIIL